MNEKLLTKFILSFLLDKEEYIKLSQEQQGLIFETCKTIMTAIYNSIKFNNVYPVIYCGDIQAQKIIKKSLDEVSELLPSTKKITIHLIQ